jgi:hypothetical protein
LQFEYIDIFFLPPHKQHTHMSPLPRPPHPTPPPSMVNNCIEGGGIVPIIFVRDYHLVPRTNTNCQPPVLPCPPPGHQMH